MKTANDVSTLATTDINRICTLDDGTRYRTEYAHFVGNYATCDRCAFKGNCQCDMPCNPVNRPDRSKVVFVRVQGTLPGDRATAWLYYLLEE